MNRDEVFFDGIEDREELAVIDLEEDDGTNREYAVLAIFSTPPYASEYMAAMALDDFEKEESEREIAFLRYKEEDDGFVLNGIDNDAELQFVSSFYFQKSKQESDEF